MEEPIFEERGAATTHISGFLAQLGLQLLQRVVLLVLNPTQTLGEQFVRVEVKSLE